MKKSIFLSFYTDFVNQHLSFVAHIILTFCSPPSLPLHHFFFFFFYQNKLSHNVFFDKNRFPKAFLKTLYCIHFLVFLKRKAKTSINNPSSSSSPQARTKECQKKRLSQTFSVIPHFCATFVKLRASRNDQNSRIFIREKKKGE